ncbi:MAG: type II toxin-antitoxin system VapC family toxin [Caldilineaceae bacterium]
MKYLLDTNACIRFLNGRSPSIQQEMRKHKSEDILLCSVVKAELLVGMLKNDNPAGRLRKIQPFFDRFASLSFDDDAATSYAEIRTDLEKQGVPIGPNDLLIAALAIANQLVLVTHNTREFGRVKGLMLEDWEI